MINSHTILKEQPAVLLHFLTNFCCGFLSEMDFQSGVSVVGGCSSYRRIPIRYFLLSSFFALTRASRVLLKLTSTCNFLRSLDCFALFGTQSSNNKLFEAFENMFSFSVRHSKTLYHRIPTSFGRFR